MCPRKNLKYVEIGLRSKQSRTLFGRGCMYFRFNLKCDLFLFTTLSWVVFAENSFKWVGAEIKSSFDLLTVVQCLRNLDEMVTLMKKHIIYYYRLFLSYNIYASLPKIL